MRNVFEHRDSKGRWPAVLVIAILVFLAPLSWWAVQQIRVENDFVRWLSLDHADRQTLEAFQQLFPPGEPLLVSWDESSLGDPRVDALVNRFQGVTDQQGIKRNGVAEIAGVVEPKLLLRQIQENDVESQEAARRLHGMVLGAGPLKVKLSDAGRQRFRKTRADLGKAVRKKFGVRIDMRDAIPNLAELAAIPSPVTEEDETVVPQAASAAALTPAGQLAMRDSVEHDLQLVWPGMAPGSAKTQEIVEFLLEFRGPQDDASTHPPLIEDCFFVIGAPVAIAVHLSDAGRADPAAALEAIRAAAQSVRIPRESLHIAGFAAADESLDGQIHQTAWNESEPVTNLARRSVVVFSLVLVSAATFLMIRSIRHTALVLAASAYATCLSLAIIFALGAQLNLLLGALPALVFLFTHCSAFRVVQLWRRAAAENLPAAKNAFEPSLFTGIATAAGLAALCLSPLPAVRELGFFGSIGVLVSTVVVLYGLPAILSLWASPTASRQSSDHRGWRELGRRLTIRPTLQSASMMLMAGACAMGLVHVQTRSNTIQFFRSKSDIVRDHQFLEDQIAGSIPVEVLVRFDADALDHANFLERMELIRGVEERLRSLPDITGSLSLADFQPVTDVPPQDAGMLTQSRFHKRAAVTQGRIRDGELPEAEFLYRYSPVDEQSVGVGEQAQLGAAGEEVWRISARANALQDADWPNVLAEIDRSTREVLRYQPGAHHLITGTASLALETQHAALASLLRGFGAGFGLMFVVFIFYLRDLRAALVAMLANCLPVIMVFGVLSWCRQPVDLGVILTAIIALAFTADGTLHLLAAYRRELAEGISRNSAIIRALEQCGPVLWQSRLVSVCGLLALLPAELPLISRFGGFAAALVGVSLICQTVLLPQLIAGLLGRWFRPARQPLAARTPMVHPAETIVPPAPHAADVESPTEAAGLQRRGRQSDGA